jgi:acetyl esterase/lipase
MLIASALFTVVLLFLLASLAGRALPRHPGGQVLLVVEKLEERFTPSTYTQSNLPYGTNSAQVLDVYSNTAYTNAPVVVLIHGGGWYKGNKTGIENIYSPYYLSQGFVVVAPDYRLVTPNAFGGYVNQFPTAIDDVASAIAWVQAHAAQYGANPNAIIVQGSSAGTQIAAMLAYDPTGFGNWGLPSPLTGIVGYVGDSAPFDWALVPANSRGWPHIQTYLGSLYGSPQWSSTEPISFVHPGEVPALIIAGTADKTVGYKASEEFNTAMQQAGNKTTFELYQGYTHGEFSHNFRTSPAEQQVLTSWLQSLGL